MEVSGVSSQELRNQFLMLLLAQLRNQDPLSPVQQHEFITQLAQFSSLEGIEEMNDGFGQLVELQRQALRQQEFGQAQQIVGRTITYSVPQSPEGESAQRTGVVDQVTLEGENVWLHVGQDKVALSNLVAVHTQNDQGFGSLPASSASPVPPNGPPDRQVDEQLGALLSQLQELL